MAMMSGRLDAVGGQRNLAEFPGRDHGVGDGPIREVVVDVERPGSRPRRRLPRRPAAHGPDA